MGIFICNLSFSQPIYQRKLHLFLGSFVKMHNRLMEEKIQTHLENEFMTSHFYEFLGEQKTENRAKKFGTPSCLHFAICAVTYKCNYKELLKKQLYRRKMKWTI